MAEQDLLKRAGKILKGNGVVGLTEVYHDDTLSGKGTQAEPLSVTESGGDKIEAGDFIEITDSDDKKKISVAPTKEILFDDETLQVETTDTQIKVGGVGLVKNLVIGDGLEVTETDDSYILSVKGSAGWNTYNTTFDRTTLNYRTYTGTSAKIAELYKFADGQNDFGLYFVAWADYDVGFTNLNSSFDAFRTSDIKIIKGKATGTTGWYITPPNGVDVYFEYNNILFTMNYDARVSGNIVTLAVKWKQLEI